MEEIIKVKKEGGIYDCNANVTVEEWKLMLQDTSIATDKVIRVLQLYYNEPNHASTSENLKLKYGGTRQSYFVPFSGFCNDVQLKLNRFHVKNTNEKNTYYIIAVTGRYVTNRHFEYTLRPELVQAMEELNITNNEHRMKARNYYVISPNVWKNENQQYFEEIMFKEQIVLMGWGTDKPHGQLFFNMQIGDIVIVAQGANRQKRSFFIGEIRSNSSERETEVGTVAQYKKLINFVDVRKIDLGFNENCTYGASNQIVAIYKLKKSNPSDRNVMLNVDKLIQTKLNKETMEKYTNLLLSNKNIVLTGAPGTGKSYLAKRIAEEITKDGGEIGFVQFHPSYDYTDFVEGLRAEEVESGGVTFTLKNGIFKEFCKKAIARQEVGRSFDELYDDFVTNQIEGLELFTPILKKPIKFKINSRKLFEVYSEKTRWVIKKELIRSYVIDNKVTDWKSYTMAIGDKFKELYGSELNKPLSNDNPNKYVFIIDEINRGEISKIFGELFYSIDPGYRGRNGKIKTQYQNLHSYETDTIFDPELGNGWFYVPDNVYVIGTMNDIGRSVESMDFAMRRRFTWVEIDAESRVGMLDGYDWSEEAVEKMLSINAEIEKIDGLGKPYHVGPAYFLKLKSYQDDIATMWDRLWEYHIEPLVKEYLRGMQSAEDTLAKIEVAYYGKDQY